MIAIPEPFVYDELLALVTRFFLGRNLSVKCSNDILKTSKAARLENVTREERSSSWDSTLNLKVRR